MHQILVEMCIFFRAEGSRRSEHSGGVNQYIPGNGDVYFSEQEGARGQSILKECMNAPDSRDVYFLDQREQEVRAQWRSEPVHTR
jgi:hypothetical protein